MYIFDKAFKNRILIMCKDEFLLSILVDCVFFCNAIKLTEILLFIYSHLDECILSGIISNSRLLVFHFQKRVILRNRLLLWSVCLLNIYCHHRAEMCAGFFVNILLLIRTCPWHCQFRRWQYCIAKFACLLIRALFLPFLLFWVTKSLLSRI